MTAPTICDGAKLSGNQNERSDSRPDVRKRTPYSVRSTSRTGNGYDRSNIKTHRKQKAVRTTITWIRGAWDWKMEDVSGDMTGGKDKDRRGKSEI